MNGWQRAALVIGLFFSASCWEDPASTVGRAHLVVAFNPLGGGAFTATLNGQTFSSPGQYSVHLTSLDPAYEVAGTFQGEALRIEFHTTTAAGVQAGSVANVEGPVSQIFTCAITYVSTGSGSQSFRARFRLSGTENQVCR